MKLSCVNATVIKKYKKQDDKDLSEVKCFACHKKGHYEDKCPNKELKN